MVLSSVGNLKFEKLVKFAEKYFGSAVAKYRTEKRKPFDNYIPRARTTVKDTFQTHCIIGNLAYDVQHENRIVMVLLNNIIGGPAMNSRLNLSLRERRGMAYNVESGYTSYTDTGLFNVYFGTDKENYEKAIELVYKEFKLLRETKLGGVQLSKAKKQLIGQIAISTESHDDLMLAIGKSYLLYNRVDPLQVVFKKIEEITSEKILEVANIVLAEKQMSTLVYH
jgi:predicted Zn-dependent peptidase